MPVEHKRWNGGRLEPVLQLRESRPTGVRLLALVLVRLAVQILPAHGAEAGTVLAAEDLVREGQRDGIVQSGHDWLPALNGVRYRDRLVGTASMLVLAPNAEVLATILPILS